MMGFRRLWVAGVLTSSVLLSGQVLPEPRKQFGSSVTGAFEGWYENGDGTPGFLVGYYNRNSQQTLDVPVAFGEGVLVVVLLALPLTVGAADPADRGVVGIFRAHWWCSSGGLWSGKAE